jgi:hypothetical membrane protein
MRHRSGLTVLALCGIVAPVVFVLLVIVAGTFYPGYSHITQAISELGGVGAPNPLIQNTNFFVVGVLIVAFALGLRRNLTGAGRSALGATLVAAFGFVLVVHAVVPCDVGCEFVSPAGATHNITGLAGFLSVIAGILLLSRVFALDPDWRSYRGYSVLTAVVGLASLVSWIALAKAARIEVMNGSLQRVFAGTILLWVEVVAVRLFVLSRSSAARERAAQAGHGSG